MQKESNKKHRLSIRILILLFLGSLAYSVYDVYGPFEIKNNVDKAKEDIPEYFDYGAVNDSIYCNDFFRLRIPLSKGYQATYKIYDYTQTTIYQRDSVLAVPQLATAIDDQDLLIIEPEFIKYDWLKDFKKTKNMNAFSDYISEKSKRERFGADYQLIIRAHNLKHSSLSAYLNQFGNLHNPNYGSPKSRTISGISFREHEGVESQGSSMQEVMFSIIGGKNRNIISYNTKIHGFALSIDLFYQTEEKKCILLDMVDTIRFQ